MPVWSWLKLNASKSSFTTRFWRDLSLWNCLSASISNVRPLLRFMNATSRASWFLLGKPTSNFAKTCFSVGFAHENVETWHTLFSGTAWRGSLASSEPYTCLHLPCLLDDGSSVWDNISILASGHSTKSTKQRSDPLAQHRTRFHEDHEFFLAKQHPLRIRLITDKNGFWNKLKWPILDERYKAMVFESFIQGAKTTSLPTHARLWRLLPVYNTQYIYSTYF